MMIPSPLRGLGRFGVGFPGLRRWRDLSWANFRCPYGAGVSLTDCPWFSSG
jgi:hypothetical protein